MALSKSDNGIVEEDGPMSIAEAQTYARLMVQRETKGPGDIDRALKRLEDRYKISRWQLSHLRKGNAKTIKTTLYKRVESAFIDHCRRQAARLLHEADMARKAGKAHDDLAAIQSEIAALAARLEAAKGKAAR